MSDPILEIITMFMGSALKYSVFIALLLGLEISLCGRLREGEFFVMFSTAQNDYLKSLIPAMRRQGYRYYLAYSIMTGTTTIILTFM